MAKFADTNLFDFENDFEAYFDQGFNRLINSLVEDLSTPENSPVYTGYFASSWRASSSPIDRESREKSDKNRRTKSPWKAVYETPTRGTGDSLTPWGVKKNMGVIERRYPGPFDFNFKQYPTVYIGNTTHYAPYALEDGKTIAFLGDVKQKVNEAFAENQRLGQINVAAQASRRNKANKTTQARNVSIF
jgi:hypothetical protein